MYLYVHLYAWGRLFDAFLLVRSLRGNSFDVVFAVAEPPGSSADACGGASRGVASTHFQMRLHTCGGLCDSSFAFRGASGGQL